MADLGERPAPLDADVYVDAAASRGLGKAGVAEIVQEHARLRGDPHRVREVGSRLGIEVQAQLVRMVYVVAANRPGMERDRAHLRTPTDDRHLGGADLVGVAARRELDARGLHVVRSPSRDALLEEGVAAALLPRREDEAGMHALRPPLERRRAPLERAHDAVPHGEVVLDDVELRDRVRPLGGRKDDPVRAGDPQLAPAGVDDRCVRHRGSVRARAAAQSLSSSISANACPVLTL